MIDKIKNYVVELIKPIQMKLLSVVLALIALVYYLVSLGDKNKDLEQKLVVSEDTNKLEESLIKEKEAHDEANKAEDDYKSIRSSYLEQHHNGDDEPPTAT
jgi:hypothetical protein